MPSALAISVAPSAPLRPQFAHLCRLYGGLPASIDASRLGLGDVFQLPLPTQVRFEFGEHVSLCSQFEALSPAF